MTWNEENIGINSLIPDASDTQCRICINNHVSDNLYCSILLLESLFPSPHIFVMNYLITESEVTPFVYRCSF